MKKKKLRWFFYLTGLTFIIFLIIRLVQPLSVYIVTDEFAYPIDIGEIPAGLESISVKECEKCHPEIAGEWKTSMHSKAWTDPYFQVDWEFEHKQQTCLNCHTPLKDQQPDIVLGFKDKYRLKPILEPNRNYDPSLREEGVTCAVCHVKEGIIHGPYGSKDAPHPVKKDKAFTDGSSVCKRCHLVKGKRWDTFYKLSPCGTFDEIIESGKKTDCPGCHMPETKRNADTDEKPGKRRKHLFRGGHYPSMVKRAVKVELIREETGSSECLKFILKLTNIGTDHRFPTGTPDRHITVSFKTLSKDKKIILEKKTFKLIRRILWRPFIIELGDTRLKAKETRSFPFKLKRDDKTGYLQVTVKYHLLDEKRRKRIGYQNTEPIDFEIFFDQIDLSGL